MHNQQEEKIKIQESLIVIAAGFLVFYIILDISWLKWISLAVLLIAAFSSWLSRWIHILWMKLAHAMGFVMSKVLLSLVFFLFLTPIALLYRITRKKSERKNASSFYFVRNHTYTAKDLKNVW